MKIIRSANLCIQAIYVPVHLHLRRQFVSLFGYLCHELEEWCLAHVHVFSIHIVYVQCLMVVLLCIYIRVSSRESRINCSSTFKQILKYFSLLITVKYIQNTIPNQTITSTRLDKCYHDKEQQRLLYCMTTCYITSHICLLFLSSSESDVNMSRSSMS